MIRKLLFSLFALSLVGTVSAQSLSIKQKLNQAKKSNRIERVVTPSKAGLVPAGRMWIGPSQKMTSTAKSSKLTKVPMKAETEPTYTIFSYPEDANGKLNIAGYGWNQYNLAVLVPKTYANAKADMVAFFVIEPSKLSNMKLWFNDVEKGLPTTPETADYCMNVSSEQIKGLTENGVEQTVIELPTPYTIPANGCVVGYSFTTTFNPADKNDYGRFQVVTYPTEDVNGGFFIQDLGGDGTWYNQYGSGDGNLTTAVRLDVTGMPSSSVLAGYIDDVTAKLNEETEVCLVLRNDGFSPVSSVNYVLTVDGVAQPEATYKFDEPLAAGGVDGLYASYIPTVADVNEVSITVTKVDGEANTSAQASADGTVLVLEEVADRTSVVEEFTGTWCGWCPRGAVGLDMLKSQLGNKVITLAGHFGNGADQPDPMECADYSNKAYAVGTQILGVDGFPGAMYDRVIGGDPYYGINGRLGADGKVAFGAGALVEAIQRAIYSEANVALKANWTDDSKTKISANVSTTFLCNRFDAPYGIAFVLSEDGMAGKGDFGAQANYYSTAFANYYKEQTGEDFTAADPFKNADMQGWINAPMLVDAPYNHVVVGAWDIIEGAENSITAPILKGMAKSYDVTLDISSNTLIQNKENLSLTVLLINQNTYGIVNAAQIPLGTGAGIKDVAANGSNAKEIARYNVNGQLISAPQKGLNIVKLSNGETVKVIVK